MQGNKEHEEEVEEVGTREECLGGGAGGVGEVGRRWSWKRGQTRTRLFVVNDTLDEILSCLL